VKKRAAISTLVTLLFAYASPAFSDDPQNAASTLATAQDRIAPPETNQPADATNFARFKKADDFSGNAVENKNGEELGSLKDIVIDTESGRVVYVIVSTGGFAGFGTRLKDVPPIAFSAATSKRDTLALDISPSHWKSAPNFANSQLASLGTPAQMRRIYQFYRQPLPSLSEKDPGPAPALMPAGRSSEKPVHLQLASRLAGEHIVDPQGHDLGKISDVLVDLANPRTSFVLVKPGSFVTDSDSQITDELFAISFSAFTSAPRTSQLTLRATPDQFRHAFRQKSGSGQVVLYQAGDLRQSIADTRDGSSGKGARHTP
jgi:sporulation protein YlmC with PRC-barrel domain